MKNTIKSILIALVIFTGINVNAQKLGHVNSQAIMQELPDYEAARKDLESYKNDLTKELEMYQKLIVIGYRDPCDPSIYRTEKR